MRDAIAAEQRARREQGRPLGYNLPEDAEDIYRLASAIAGGRLAPERYAGDRRLIALAIFCGMEGGLPPMVSVREIEFLEGRPVVSHTAAVILLQQSGLLRAQRVEWRGGAETPVTALEPEEWPGARICTVSLARRGQRGWYRGSSSLSDLMQAGELVELMSPIEAQQRIYARAWERAQRFGFADLLNGLLVRDDLGPGYEREQRAEEQNQRFLRRRKGRRGRI